jgi:hypothetical protein
MISIIKYLFEIIPDSIEYSSDFTTEGPARIFKAKLKEYQDSQTFGAKLYDKFHPQQDDSAFEAAKETARKRWKDSLPKENWYKSK